MDDAVQHAAAPKPTEPPPLRLSILHLFLWMTATASILAIRYEREIVGELPDRERTFYVALAFTSAIINGIPSASLYLLIMYGFRRPTAFPRQPGHWMLIGMGLSYLVLTVLDIFTARISGYCISAYLYSLTWIATLAAAVTAIKETGWKAIFALTIAVNLFGMLAILSFSESLNHEHYLRLQSAIHIHWALFAALVAIETLRGWRTKRDWLHQVAIAVVLAKGVQAIALLIWRPGH